jgi:uncharacterized protein YciU (UPF0263 family)
MATKQITDRGIAEIEQHTDDLQDLADSELPCSELAEALLSLEGSKDG